MSIGVVGLGKMGATIAERLIAQGEPLIVWNRSPDKATPLVKLGAILAATPAEIAVRSDVVISMLTDADAIDAVYHGASGLLSVPVTDKLFIEMSTVRPHVEQALAVDVRAAGAAFVECPVGGTVGPAREGKLLGFAGGEKRDVERAHAVLSHLCRRIDHVGPVGAGAKVKLAVNLPLVVYWQALGEAYALCRDLDLPRQRLIEIFQETSGAPNVLRARGAVIAKALNGDDIGSGIFDCDNIRKDLRAMVGEAAALGMTLPVAAKTLDVFDEASKRGWGGRDCCELPRYWSEMHGGAA